MLMKQRQFNPTQYACYASWVQRSFGNVFADLGLPDADKLKIKTGLVLEIRKAIEARGLTQQAAAKRMGLTQPKVSEMMRGNFQNLSERKLIDCLTQLGDDEDIHLLRQ
jgi:predicted XRE-type DNA-binding protein